MSKIGGVISLVFKEGVSEEERERVISEMYACNSDFLYGMTYDECLNEVSFQSFRESFKKWKQEGKESKETDCPKGCPAGQQEAIK
jgi:hypothetical protein